MSCGSSKISTDTENRSRESILCTRVGEVEIRSFCEICSRFCRESSVESRLSPVEVGSLSDSRSRASPSDDTSSIIVCDESCTRERCKIYLIVKCYPVSDREGTCSGSRSKCEGDLLTRESESVRRSESDSVVSLSRESSDLRSEN